LTREVPPNLRMPCLPGTPPRTREVSARRSSAERRLGLCLGLALAAMAACAPPEPQAPVSEDGWEEFSDPAGGSQTRVEWSSRVPRFSVLLRRGAIRSLLRSRFSGCVA